MDPKATYREFRDALGEGRHEEALSLGSDLQRWLFRGGFAPEGFNAEWFRGAMMGLRSALMTERPRA